MKKSIRLIIFPLFFFSSFIYVWPQPHTEFLHIGTENGLSNNSVTSIIQDSLGFIWIGTKYGLNRYDGTNFKQYTQDQHGIPTNDISILKIDRKNRLWVGTYSDGLFLYDYFNDRFRQILFNNVTPSSNNIEIHSLFEDKQGWIWIATNEGLYSYDLSGKSNYYRQSEHESDVSGRNNIRAIIETPDNRLWIGTLGSGIYMFDKKTGKFENLDHLSFSGLSINSDYINALFADKKGNLLVGTNGNGLKFVDFQQKRITNYLSGTAYENLAIVRCIWQDQSDNLWIGTDGIGILYIKNRQHRILDIKNYRSDDNSQFPLSNNTVNSLFEDSQSNLWIATAKRGISIVKKQIPGIDYYYSDGQGKYNTPILSIFSDKNSLWMGTDGVGLTLLNYQNAKARFFTKTTQEYVGDFVQCIRPAKDGSFWIGTYAQGLYNFNPDTKKIQNYIRKPGASISIYHNNIQDILVLPSGNLWIATWGGGLIYFDIKAQITTTFKNEPGNTESLGNDNVLALCLDTSGRLWLATYGGGLSMYDSVTKIFKNYKAENNPGLTSNYIYTLLFGDDNTLWLGTKDGLSQFDLQTHTFKNIPINGADSQQKTIVSLLKDRNENIWAGTQKGIMCIEKGNNNINFIPELNDNFCLNSAFMDEDGRLYFGSNKQVVAFTPSHIQFEASFPPTYFTDLKLFNKSVPVNDKSILKTQICFEDKITLKHNQSVVTIEYATLKYPFSKDINYEIKLEGLESEWHNVGTQNVVTFTNLSPGKYTLMVRPITGQLYPDTKPAQLDIRVLPPLWLTWWAYLIYFLLIIGVFYIFRRYTLKLAGIKNELNLEKFRHEQEEHIFQLKQHFFTNISHDIRTPLTLIAGSINKLFNRKNADVTEEKHLVAVRSNTNRLLHLTEELLNFRKLETGNVTLRVTNENLVEFIREIYISYTQLAVNKNIRYEFKYSHPDISVWIDKFQFERTICNLISNAFQYTSAGGAITIDISLENTEEVQIKIIDTGKGIEPEKLKHIFDHFYQVDKTGQGGGFGVGLSIAREIVILHGGNISVSSKFGEGSVFTILLHSGKDHLKNVEFVTSSLETNIFSEYFVEKDIHNSFDVILEDNPKEYSVLIVEDNPDIRNYLAELLSSRYSIYEACDGQDGFEKAVELFPDIVISDIMMPIMDGITLCSKLKSDMRTSHIPVILLTARTLISSVIEGLETGADEYLTKPFDENILLIKINNLLQNRKRIREYISKELAINPEDVNLNSQDNIFLSKLVKYIEEHIEESEFNIVQMANTLGMSHSSLYKKVKALTGITVIGFVKDFRLKKAAQLLIQDQHYIKEIAYMVGYSDRRHFSNDFKKKFDATPSDYINKYSQK